MKKIHPRVRCSLFLSLSRPLFLALSRSLLPKLEVVNTERCSWGWWRCEACHYCIISTTRSQTEEDPLDSHSVHSCHNKKFIQFDNRWAWLISTGAVGQINSDKSESHLPVFSWHSSHKNLPCRQPRPERHTLFLTQSSNSNILPEGVCKVVLHLCVTAATGVTPLRTASPVPRLRVSRAGQSAPAGLPPGFSRFSPPVLHPLIWLRVRLCSVMCDTALVSDLPLLSGTQKTCLPFTPNYKTV